MLLELFLLVLSVFFDGGLLNLAKDINLHVLPLFELLISSLHASIPLLLLLLLHFLKIAKVVLFEVDILSL